MTRDDAVTWLLLAVILAAMLLAGAIEGGWA